MACHNRVLKTSEAVALLKGQQLRNTQLDLFLLDDGSTDGTAGAVRAVFPGVHILEGDGNLYWCGGMRVALDAAMKGDYDFYLWLNDDTLLDTAAVDRLLDVHRVISQTSRVPTMVVGSVVDLATGLFSYGGWRRRGGLVARWEKAPPDNDRAIDCDTANGNCVLVPRDVVARIGNLDTAFTHGMGDMDYGLRAIQSGCRVVIAPGYYGTCEANDGKGLWSDTSMPLLLRWKRLIGPKGFPPREWAVFSRRHRGPFWFPAFVGLYLRFWVRALGHFARHWTAGIGRAS